MIALGVLKAVKGTNCSHCKEKLDPNILWSEGRHVQKWKMVVEIPEVSLEIPHKRTF
jgi:hypothetical protein